MKQGNKEQAIEMLKYLEKFGLSTKIRDALVMNNQLYYSDNVYGAGVIQPLNEDTVPTKVWETIQEIQKEDNVFVYHVTHEYTRIGELWDLLITFDEEDKNMSMTCLMGGSAYAYVLNIDDDSCSEYGYIGLAIRTGGLIRRQ